MALDYGRARIGVALSDENRRISFPRPFIAAEEFQKLAQLAVSENVELVLLGLPKNLRGAEGEMAKEVRAFGQRLESETKIAVEYIDERFSTRQARQQLREDGTPGRKTRSVVDSLSAQVILEQYLHDLQNK
ncbi:MAG: hypothetical protein UX81_C0027G0009 [Parcubacteria group bacterium GW2011_GWA2_47_12]|nr:MAG: hypothetical protein UX81_C0027G0009 [Parcubacteria group bacterium GW2011_GWA2_47_12]